MSEPRYKIVFDGALQPGVDITTAKLNLADLFKSDVAAIERLFNGRTVALKRDLSHSDAQTYLQALGKTGIDARIEAETPIELNLSDVHEQSAAVAEPDSPYAPPRAAVGESLPAFAPLKPFSVEGRIGRLRYLAWSMVLSLVTLPIVSVFALIGLGLVSADSTTGLIIGGLLAFFLFLAFAIVGILFSIQRLHDIGWSGWLWLLTLVPFVGSFFPLVIMVVPGNTGANRYGPPPPPNSTAVKVLCSLWIVFIGLFFMGGLLGGITAIQQEYESSLESSYESGSVTTDEIDVEVEPAANSADDAAEAALAPVDSAKE
ncbi:MULTISPECIES: DUF805 domain-containing protein [Pseudomonas]|uniref:Membrane protein n=1 Tax=Pseudomonas fluorescens TaxID=294 RepID=A0AAE2A944_PSEFL|nr:MULTISPECIES: DUF805 domain-containing protein [Pseudomonas]KIF61202.1 membrane protein [Pseudomonas fluorescens]TFA86052.1 uncharacterized membrane protein YhaH (DUF805 family) [Pseudomonas sp. LAIL14HWK12:I2]SCZ43695.1 Uncharacterized membrane protein YhaH, DUF805 family [Pseudomonas sp. NFIX46]SDB65272.1 Uncharacterized membrane protein YhaH, DUF805 family [Pseudomonas putida]SFQ94092.1 Uncharacterized membrane protein YhaH, DUF805 family [Pseudomonas sp. NFIX49]